MSAIQSAGGKVLGGKTNIPTVGELVAFEDTEGNEGIIIQYTPERLAEVLSS